MYKQETLKYLKQNKLVHRHLSFSETPADLPNLPNFTNHGMEFRKKLN